MNLILQVPEKDNESSNVLEFLTPTVFPPILKPPERSDLRPDYPKTSHLSIRRFQVKQRVTSSFMHSVEKTFSRIPQVILIFRFHGELTNFICMHTELRTNKTVNSALHFFI